MNRPSRTDEPYEGEGYNQSPNHLSADLTTNQDLNGISNVRELRRAPPDPQRDTQTQEPQSEIDRDPSRIAQQSLTNNDKGIIGQPSGEEVGRTRLSSSPTRPHLSEHSATEAHRGDGLIAALRGVKAAVVKFGSFIGPGFMIAVAYIDPGNYATDVAAGATYRFQLLFVVLLANLFAIFLQSLCIRLGTITGLNLAEACRRFLPKWLNYILYFFAEVSIIATDIAEVIGFAIGLNLLVPAIPLVAGCAISIADVMVILFFYQPHKSLRGIKIFEYFILCLVMGVVICFCIQLSLIKDVAVGDVFRGYVPSGAIVEQQGLYQACGILGATVMPHSLYLGSGIVQPRLRDYDMKHGLLDQETENDVGPDSLSEKRYYEPSLQAINHSLRVTTAELALVLFTFALFVNSAILIVAGASLYNNPDAPDADIFSIHALLSASIAPAAGTIFALALLLSGISAGIVCTIAGQMVSEGALNWRLRPWLRRLVTRTISITPSIVIAGAVGRSGLSEALNASQVVLSVVLPFVTAPLIWFTCFNKYMTVQVSSDRPSLVQSDVISVNSRVSGGPRTVKMANPWFISGLAVIIWLAITGLNVANLVLLGKGN